MGSALVSLMWDPHADGWEETGSKNVICPRPHVPCEEPKVFGLYNQYLSAPSTLIRTGNGKRGTFGF